MCLLSLLLPLLMFLDVEGCDKSSEVFCIRDICVSSLTLKLLKLLVTVDSGLLRVRKTHRVLVCLILN